MERQELLDIVPAGKKIAIPQEQRVLSLAKHLGSPIMNKTHKQEIIVQLLATSLCMEQPP